jgi:8-oxo-dGTP diphosphatase
MTVIPKQAASVALIRDRTVLLIQRARQPNRGLWTLPGGRIEPGETADECATREINEELGLTVAQLHRIGRQDVRGRQDNWHITVFATDNFVGEIRPSDEITDLRWVSKVEASKLRTTALLGSLLDGAFSLFPRS